MIMAAFNTKSNGQTTLIQYWNFNNFTSVVTLPEIASIAADYSILDTAKARIVYQPVPGTSSAYSTYIDNSTGDTTNARMGAVAGNSLRPRNPNDSMELLFYIPSTGYKNLVFKYATESSSYTSGDSAQAFSYSLDSGATWISSGTGLSEWVDSAQLTFTLKTVTINDTNAYNNRKLVFRIITVGRNSGTSGNNRYDNVTLDGTPISTAGVEEVVTPKYVLYPNPAANNINVVSEVGGAKSITILNGAGQNVYTTEKEGTFFSVNTNSLSKGNYFITILDRNSGNATTMRFTKL